MTLRLSSPNIIRLRATGYEPEAEDEVLWKITFIDKLLKIKKAARPVYAILRASSEDGWGEIEVGGLAYGSRNAKPEELKVDLVESGTAETLYDFARSHLQLLLAQIGSPQSTPRKAPEPEIRFIERDEFERILDENDDDD